MVLPMTPASDDLRQDRYFIINKPYGMVSQFTSPHDVQLLKDLDFRFPTGTHALGRLDKHSEGLLLLTTNKKVTRLLFQSAVPHKRVYLVQLKNQLTDENLKKLQEGVSLEGKGGQRYISKPFDVAIVQKPVDLTAHPGNLHKYPSTTWLSLCLTEGKFHQVRKMVAAVQHRCLRLIRLSIEDIFLGDLQPGGVRELGEKQFFEQLNITPD
jgi:23S rRNA pseudouridine2457 synthase